MELTQVKGNTYVLEGEELIPLYLLDNGKCILLDTGLLEEREDLETTAIPHERVTTRPVPVREEILIPDLLAALREQERQGTVRLIPWEQVDEANRRWIVDAERREILDRGLLDRPEDPTARYLREKYPESWVLAREERGCP